MSSVETRHYHGTIWHDHERGSVLHDHDAQGRMVTPRSPYRGEALITFGIVLAILGGTGMVWQSNNHSACGSVLVQAAANGQCSEANAVWTLGIVGLVLGIAMAIVGAIMRSKSS